MKVCCPYTERFTDERCTHDGGCAHAKPHAAVLWSGGDCTTERCTVGACVCEEKAVEIDQALLFERT